jgi:phosphoglycolate phosphatase-like HAD superfamily hydrolase
MVRLILFDIDGTLIHSGGAGVTAFGRAFTELFGVERPTEGVRFAGRTDTSLIAELFARHGIAGATADAARFFDAYLRHLGELLPSSRGGLCAGVREFIAALGALAAPPRLALLTGNIRRGAELKLRHFELWERFEFGAFGDDHHDRNELAVIAQRRGGEHFGHDLGGEEILVIGDTPRDIECARAIGARCLAVATGGDSLEELTPHRADWTVRDLGEVSAADVCR